MRYKDMDLFHGIRNKPNYSGLKLMIRSLFLSLIIVFISGFDIKGANADYSELGNKELFVKLFQDLANEGLVKMGDRALFLTSSNNNEAVSTDAPQLVVGCNIDIMSYYNFEHQRLIPDAAYDLVFANDDAVVQVASDLIDRTLKKDGIVVVRVSEYPRNIFKKPSNYRIVYLRRFDSTVVGMRRIDCMDRMNSAMKRRNLLGLPVELKKAALRNLEDVLLEPPRATSGKSNRYFKRTRYLPDLIGDSLESYSRRVFINVGKGEDFSNDPNWFSKHYPTRNTKFEIYNIETLIMEEPMLGRKVAQIGMSDWLRKNVQENEYVVMKAEAEVVEEMVKNRSINLVDELFLECKHRGIKKSIARSRRAYWECLALYGMLRDEGIAVHQWWG